MNYLTFSFHFPILQELLYGPACKSAQTGAQAGPLADAAGLGAGPGWAPGRGSIGVSARATWMDSGEKTRLPPPVAVAETKRFSRPVASAACPDWQALAGSRRRLRCRTP